MKLSVARSPVSGRVMAPSSKSYTIRALACASLGVAAGVQIVRAHDVAETVQAIRMTEAILAKQNV